MSQDPLNGVSPALAIALTLRFLLELALLAGTAVLAWHVAPDGWRWVAGVVAPIVVAIGWGVCLSPKAPVVLPAFARLVIEGMLFVGVGVGLLFIGFAWPAAIGVVIWALDRIALTLLHT